MRYAWDGLARRRARSAATALGIGLATGLVVLLLALSAGVTSSASTLAASSGIDLIATSANTSLEGSSFPPVDGAHGLPAAMAAADPNVASASPWLLEELVFANASLYAASNASPGGASVPAGWVPTGASAIGWIPGDNAGIEVPSVVTGPGFSSSSDPRWSNGSYSGPVRPEIVLDQALAGVLHVGVGSILWVSSASPTGPAALPAWFSGATALRVVGLSGPFWLVPSALLSFTYLSELQTIEGGAVQGRDQASLLLVHLRSDSDDSLDQSRLSLAFPGLTVFTVNDVLASLESVVDLYRTFGTLIGVIGLVVAALFSTTVLLMSVDDRSREIALLRAIGFGPGWVAQEVLTESVLLSLFGLAIGSGLGYLGARAIDLFLLRIVHGLPAGFSFVDFSPAVIADGLGIVLVVGLVASVLPILRALSLPVAEELRAP